MAGTGILLAAHGGALANIMYMPAHAVVIEAFPYVTHFTMYQRLAQVANLQYYRLRGFRPPPVLSEDGKTILADPWASYNEADFVYDCEWPHHTSSVNAMLQRSCNGKTKVTPIAIDEGTFRAVLDMALDDIECKDSICRFDTPGQSMFYKDMRTNETWTPIMSGFVGSMLPEDLVGDHLQKSRNVMGRIWEPRLFERNNEEVIATTRAATLKKAADEAAAVARAALSHASALSAKNPTDPATLEAMAISKQRDKEANEAAAIAAAAAKDAAEVSARVQAGKLGGKAHTQAAVPSPAALISAQTGEVAPVAPSVLPTFRPLETLLVPPQPVVAPPSPPPPVSLASLPKDALPPKDVQPKSKFLGE
jgi:hypothetical protein